MKKLYSKLYAALSIIFLILFALSLQAATAPIDNPVVGYYLSDWTDACIPWAETCTGPPCGGPNSPNPQSMDFTATFKQYPNGAVSKSKITHWKHGPAFADTGTFYEQWNSTNNLYNFWTQDVTLPGGNVTHAAGIETSLSTAENFVYGHTAYLQSSASGGYYTSESDVETSKTLFTATGGTSGCRFYYELYFKISRYERAYPDGNLVYQGDVPISGIKLGGVTPVADGSIQGPNWGKVKIAVDGGTPKTMDVTPMCQGSQFYYYQYAGPYLVQTVDKRP